MNKAQSINELILGLRQRGMVNMHTTRLDANTMQIVMAYNTPYEAMQHVTLTGMDDLSVLENAYDHLVEHGIPVE